MAALYPFLLDPRSYPDFARRPHTVPTWETFDGRTQFATLRLFSSRRGRLVNWKEDLDTYTRRFRLGRVIWPFFSTVFARNFPDLVREIRRRKLYLFDFWGHVPGSGTEKTWGHVVPPPGMVDWLQEELGDRFLGFDNGEQDGRYIGGYAQQQCPSPADRFRQYLNFQRHFQRLGDDMGNKLTALVSLTFGHYFAREGNHILIGAETAQALPNSQIYYAFLRGAGRQYGVHWFGNASVFNRWGYKTYEEQGKASAGSRQGGPTKGTSLSLLKRLLYSHYLYNCVIVGFESSWILEDDSEKRLKGIPTSMELNPGRTNLSPIGEIQAAAGRTVERLRQPGAMLAPVALLLDHFGGWTVPRHLYTGKVCRVWGALPYEAGDYLTHGVFSLLYPGYEDASYYHDERGFLAATPFGDMADVLLSDAPGWVLGQYGLVVAAGELSADLELRYKLEGFLAGGGELVVTAENARKLWPEWGIGPAVRMPAGSRVRWTGGASEAEGREFELCPHRLPPRARVLARCGRSPAVARIPMGRGAVTLLLSPFGLNSRPAFSGRRGGGVEQPLPMPFDLLRHVRRAFERALAGQQLFSVGEGLSFVTCRKARGDYCLGIQNNGLAARPFRIAARAGRLAAVEEVALDQSEKGQPGYWPDGFERNRGGRSSDRTIAGGDVRIFRVRVSDEKLRTLPRAAPPPAPRGRLLALRGIADLKEAILRWPTFFQHFDGVKIDWTYLLIRDRAQLARERGWLERQKLRLIVDFSPGLNFYPDLTLLDTFAPRHAESRAAIDDVLGKMGALGAGEALFSLHRKPQNHCDDRRAERRFLAGVRDLCRRAAKLGIGVFLQSHHAKWRDAPSQMKEFVRLVGARNLSLALNLGHAPAGAGSLRRRLAEAGAKLGLLLLCTPQCDRYGQVGDAHLPVRQSGLDLKALGALETTQILDADYRDWNDVYQDIRAAWG